MDTQHLTQRRQTWYVKLNVPRPLQKRIGRTELVRTTGTRDLQEARRRRHSILAQMHAELEALSGTLPLPRESTEYVLQAAKEARAAVAAGKDEDEAAALLDQSLERHLEAVEAHSGTDEDGHPVMPETHVQALRLAHRVFNGDSVTLLSDAVGQYLDERAPHITKAGHAQKRRRLTAFADWLKADRDLPTITRKEAGRYVAEKLAVSKLSIKTQKDAIADLSAAWAHFRRRGLTEVNVWEDLTRTLRGSTRGSEERTKRGYRPEELETILRALPAGGYLLPLVILGAYTGARLDELCNLKTQDVSADAMRIRKGKNANSVRLLPIHPVIAGVVSTLVQSSADGYLVSGLLEGGADNKRSHYASKRYGDWLKRSLVAAPGLDFHSLRRTFSTRCRDAGLSRDQLDRLGGWQSQGMGLGLYADAPDLQALKDSIAKVSYGLAIDTYVRGLASSCAVTEQMRRRRSRKPLANPR